jgi:TolB-like protein
MIANNRPRFGIFEFDPETRELRREGVPVRLQAQPAQVRAALGDAAESPRFVRTILKKGYQFVTRFFGAEPKTEVPTGKVPRRWPLLIAVAGFPLGVLTIMGWNRWVARSEQPFVRVAVARFDNETGNPDYNRTAEVLTDSLTLELASAGVGKYDVIGNATILRTPRGQRDLLAISSALKASYVVLGQIQNAPGEAVVLAHLIALPEQTHVQVVRSEFKVADVAHSEVEITRRIAAEFSKPLADGRRGPSARADSK